MPRGDNSQTVKATLGLRQVLFDGEIRPGERLVELALVERLGVSRTPLRLALMTLEHEGLVESLPGGGYAVRAFSRPEIDDAIELRGLLEGAAARFASERLQSPQELEGIRTTTARLDLVLQDDEPGLLASYVSLNETFHAQLLALAKSDVLSRELAHVTALPFASPAALLASQEGLPEWRETLFVAQHQHRAIVAAIQAGQGTRAEEIAREHARLSRQNLELLLERRDLLDEIPGAPLLDAVG